MQTIIKDRPLTLIFFLYRHACRATGAARPRCTALCNPSWFCNRAGDREKTTEQPQCRWRNGSERRKAVAAEERGQLPPPDLSAAP